MEIPLRYFLFSKERNNIKTNLKPYLYTTTVLATIATAGAFTRIARADTTNQQPTTATQTQAQATTTTTTQAQTNTTTDAASITVTSASSSAASNASKASSASSVASSSADVINGKAISYASASVDVNAQTINTMTSYATKNPEIVDPTWNQNFHFNTSDGYANDIQSMSPHYASDGSIEYWDIYYLAQPLAKLQGVQYEWKHMVTTDFKTFRDFDTSDRFSINNVAIPDKYYTNPSNGASIQVADTNLNGIPWGAAASGTVLDNDGHFTTDEYGNTILPDAKLAYFTNFSNSQTIFLAYSNNDGQFHPYGPTPVMDPKQINGLQTKTDFRDPYVMRLKNGNFVAYVAGGLDDRMYVLTSSDGLKWDYHPEYTVDLTGYHVSEMPVIKTINGQPMMFFIAGSKDYTGTQSGSYVVTGSFNTDGIFIKTPESQVTKMDDGFDNFAANYTSVSANKLVSMAWLGNWTYSPNLYNYKNISHFGTYTLARTITYKNGKFLVDPIEPNSKSVGTYNLKAKSSFAVGTDNKVALNFNGDQTIKLTRQDGTNNNVQIRLVGNILTLSRSWDMNKTMNKTTSLNLGTRAKQAVLYVDNSSIEIYLPGVHKMYTLMTLSYQQNSGYNMTVSNDATVDYSTFNIDNQTSADNDKQSVLNQAKQQSQSRVANYQASLGSSLQGQLTRANYRDTMGQVKKQYQSIIKQLKKAKSVKELIKYESAFNKWMHKLTTKLNKDLKTINVKKGTKLYMIAAGVNYSVTTKTVKHVAIKKVVNINGQYWYQVKVNNKTGYITL